VYNTPFYFIILLPRVLGTIFVRMCVIANYGNINGHKFSHHLCDG
jgi:hypothetical protein